jgi:hypothetical protein
MPVRHTLAAIRHTLQHRIRMCHMPLGLRRHSSLGNVHITYTHTMFFVEDVSECVCARARARVRVRVCVCVMCVCTK